MILRTLILCAALVASWYLGADYGFDRGYKACKDEPKEVLIMSGGVASWYGPGFHGRRASNGSIFNENELTAAHRTLPFGSKVRVTNLKNGNSVLVTITDRGPYIGNRVIDLSKASAAAIGMVHDGLAKVEMRLVVEDDDVCNIRNTEVCRRAAQQLFLPNQQAYRVPDTSISLLACIA